MGPSILILFLQEVSFRSCSNPLKYWSDPSGLTLENRIKTAYFCRFLDKLLNKMPAHASTRRQL